jgi:hypothetical protein
MKTSKKLNKKFSIQRQQPGGHIPGESAYYTLRRLTQIH